MNRAEEEETNPKIFDRSIDIQERWSLESKNHQIPASSRIVSHGSFEVRKLDSKREVIIIQILGFQVLEQLLGV